MILPALAYLGIFFVVPFYSLARTSLSSSGGTGKVGFHPWAHSHSPRGVNSWKASSAGNATWIRSLSRCLNSHSSSVIL